MTKSGVLLEAARAVSAETVEADVRRVAARGLARLVDAERAGWVVVQDGEATVVVVVSAEDGDLDSGEARPHPAGATLAACALEASRTRRAVVNDDTLCVPVFDEASAHGVLFAEIARSAVWPSDAPADSQALCSFAATSLGKVALFASLESLVAQEMTHVVEREASIQLVLDSMIEGLLVCDVTGRIGPIRSRAVVEWFGEPEADATLATYLGDPVAGPWLATGFEEMVDGALPVELIAEQMPKQIVRGARTYRLAVRPVVEGEVVVQVVVTLRDVTVELAQQRVDRINCEMPVVVGVLLRDRAGFQAFVEETGALFGRLAASASFSERQRVVHTLKGNALIYGFSMFGEACHAFEDRVAEDPDQMSAENIAALEGEWRASIERLSMFLTNDDAASVRVSSRDYEALLSLINQGGDHDGLLALVRGWREPLLASVLDPYVKGARQVAARLDKDVEVVVEHGDLRLPRGELRGFCATLVHVLRNAIDHGIEAPAERAAVGKPACGRLYLGARIDAGAFVVQITDDGRGIDWSRVSQVAVARGLPVDTDVDLMNALFCDGVSTKTEVTTLSGRGVGLGATRARCEELGGTLSVRTAAGRGTTFEFSFPVARAA